MLSKALAVVSYLNTCTLLSYCSFLIQPFIYPISGKRIACEPNTTPHLIFLQSSVEFNSFLNTPSALGQTNCGNDSF